MNTPENNKKIVQRFNKEYIEGGSEKAFAEIIDPSFVNRTAPEGMPTGPEGVKYFFGGLLKPAFHDLKVEILDQVAESDKVTTYKVFHAVHNGDFFHLKASGRKVRIYVIDIIRLRDSRFVEHWNVVDWQKVSEQANK